MSNNPKTIIQNAKDRSDVRWAHPELAGAYAAMSQQTLLGLYDPSVPKAERKAQAQAAAEMWTIELDDTVEVTTYDAPGCPEEPQTPAKVYVARPVKRKETMPCVFVCSGSAMAMHMCELQPYDAWCRKYNAILVIPDYRVALDSDGAWPAAINDCHAAYSWTVEHAAELGIDPDKIAVYGESSGGTVALALCHRLKRYGITPKGCLVEDAILDDRMDAGSGLFTGEGWDAAHVIASSDAWFDGIDAERGPEAFANRATAEDCVGLCPTFLHIPEHEPSATPTLQYAEKLLEAGVYVEMHLWGGANHGCFITDELTTGGCAYGERRNTTILGNFNDIFEYDLRRSWLAE